MPVKREMLVRRDDLLQTAINDTLAPVPGAGEVLLEVEAFALTANTVTYAVVGETMRYWNFFPAAEGWGVVPAWGHARVAASRHPDIAVGERLYGYLPMATHLLVTPGKVSAARFRDMAEHRQPMAAVYNEYRRLAADPAHYPLREDTRMLFEPLFLTGFLIAETLRAEQPHADTAVLTSASSKTAFGTAYALRATRPGVRRIGLTSAGNAGFVERSGLYDAVLRYDALDPLAAERAAVVIDFAGDAALLQAIYARMPVARALRVGATHHEARGPDAVLDPKSTWFFAPDAATALTGRVGQDGFDAAVAAQWRGFVAAIETLVAIEHGSGPEALQHAWREQVAGNVRPEVGHILRL